MVWPLREELFFMRLPLLVGCFCPFEEVVVMMLAAALFTHIGGGVEVTVAAPGLGEPPGAAAQHVEGTGPRRGVGGVGACQAGRHPPRLLPGRVQGVPQLGPFGLWGFYPLQTGLLLLKVLKKISIFFLWRICFFI